ncbi:MAG TPA: lysylphosphatidylglycerol synthase transmembrane domain-containing protein [Terracidiphilus sp.]|nr:lysylphosphatidylglycerol synthase transmembrane domain-containing protein [Terracidiphilus sp.]
MKKNQLILGLVVLAALAGLVFWGRDRIHFDFAEFRSQLALADWRLIGLGLGCIYLAYVFRALRWAYLLRHNKKVHPLALLGTQVIGFTAIALIGRVADPVRPYLVAKKTGLPLSNQIAVYIVERLFDMGSMALIFSSSILLAAWFGAAGAMPHPELVKKSGYWGMLFTIAGAIFLLAVRFAGNAVAAFFERTLGVLSKKIGIAAGDKIREFRTGLDTMRSIGDFSVAAGLSIGMWLLIAASYLATTKAFVANPQLASMTPAKCVLLMVVSGVSSLVQLPVLGWFTQIGIVAAAISNFFGVAPEASTACAATLLVVTFLGIIPIGLIWAQFEHVSLRKVTVESEHAEENLQTAEAAE